MRVLLVHNEDSGSASRIDAAAELSEHGCTVTRAPVAQAVAWISSTDGAPPDVGEIDRVVVAGGDGSIGCAAALALRCAVPLAVVPAGTANDFARSIGLPDDLRAVCEIAALGTELREVDLGQVESTPFVNVASIGVAPRAAGHAEQLKGRLRSLAYPVGAALAALRQRPVEVVAHVDGDAVWSGRTWQAMVASTGAFGGWADTGLTRDGDGKLDLVVVPGDRAGRELLGDARSLLRGELAAREGVFHARGSTIELVLRRAPRIVIDGEIVDVDDRHVVATVFEDPVRVVVG